MADTIMDDLIGQLGALANDPNAPAKPRKRAAQLLDRLNAPVRVAVAGPDTAAVALLVQDLQSDDDIVLVSDQVVSADIALWCTYAFDGDEIAFWDAAPPVLQDRSLIIGPNAAHIQEMAAAYFRQWCSAGQAAQTLRRHIKHGREADADQALALLERHPPTPGTTPAKAAPVVAAKTAPPAECSILAYLQTQAERLAAYDVQDTPESCEAVLTLCAETAQKLSEMAGATADAALQEDVFDALDAITLMTLEGDLAAATEAVTLLVSLKTKFKVGRDQTDVRQMETITV